jgi:farnesyl diphosphate synthase/geranylgeranyl diphosphate synthase type II
MVLGSALAVQGGDGTDVDDLPKAVWDGALAMECLHAYSLVHDDLPAMDNDDLRRGRLTVHRAFDEALAILVGDALQSLAFECLAGRATDADAAGQVEPQEAGLRLRCLGELAVAAGAHGMVEGQALDLAPDPDTDAESVRTLHSLKTGALFRASARIGAILGGGNHEALAGLTRFGEAFGSMYQALDDLQDAGEDAGPSLVAVLGREATRAEALASARIARTALEPMGGHAQPLRELVDAVLG